MTQQILIAPSMLSADPLRLGDELRDVEKAGAHWHHVDVMDGHFVPNLTIGPGIVKAIKGMSAIPIDVHIMVSNPDEVAKQYVDAGANILTFHCEAAKHSHRLVAEIQKCGAQAGVALNPGTPLESVVPLLSVIDLVLVMSVNPGFGGQSFISDPAE